MTFQPEITQEILDAKLHSQKLEASDHARVIELLPALSDDAVPPVEVAKIDGQYSVGLS